MNELIAIRQKTAKRIVQSPIGQAALKGTLAPEMYANYLKNVWHYATFSSQVIGLAGSRCVNTHPELSDYLFHHAQEEMGHDHWAFGDLRNLGITESEILASRPTPKCAAMIGYEFFIAGHANPASIFGWLYVLEAIGDDLGRQMAVAIAQNPQFKNAIKFIEGHGVADEEHTADLTEMIEKHISGKDYEDVCHVAEVVHMLYGGMFEEV